MKLRITFKNPDAVDTAIQDAELTEGVAEEVRAVTDKFVKYGEYITIEVDTVKDTAVVMPV